MQNTSSQFSLRENTALLEELFLNSPDAIVIQSAHGIILAANRALYRLTGAAPGALSGKPTRELTPPDWRARWDHDMAMLADGKWNIFESCLDAPAAQRCTPVDVTIITRTGPATQPVTILHLHNLSIYHNVEKALVASQEQWERSFDAITDCMCVLDNNGYILRINRAMAEHFAPTAYPAGQHYSDFFSPADAAGIQPLPDPMQRAPFHLKKTAFKGITGWFSAAGYPLRDQQEQLAGAVLILRDITAQLQTEEALAKSESGLRQAAKMEAIGRLAGGIAHDFNNMLTSVLGYSSMIMKSLPPASAVREDIQEIVNAAERATALTRQLLNFSHERAIETEVADLNAIITGLESFLKRTLDEPVKMRIKLEPQLARINADVSRVEQILVNLAINARDAMPDGGQLMIETMNFLATRQFSLTHPAIQPGAYVLLEISDTGHGMPPEVLEHVFEPFFTTKPRGQGTGLGLTTIYGIVKQFGGHIQCYSEINRGTTFKVYLPRAQADLTCPEPESAMTELPRGNETILVVDDETNIVNMINQILSELGYTVLAATSCQDAIQANAGYANQIDLVLTDLVMPEMSGAELVKQLRKHRPEIKALYMSGYANSAATQIGGLTANARFLQKPFSFDTMAKRVRTALESGLTVDFNDI